MIESPSIISCVDLAPAREPPTPETDPLRATATGLTLPTESNSRATEGDMAKEASA